jgi:IrrE N-terminal-like domain
MYKKLTVEATAEEIYKERKSLCNPYAYLDEFGNFTAQKDAKPKLAITNELITNRLILENPYAYLNDSGTFSAISQKKSKYSIGDIEKKVDAIHKLIWRNRHKIWLNPPSNPIELLDPLKAIEVLGFKVSVEPSIGEIRVNGKVVEAAGILDNETRNVRLSRNYKPEVIRFTGAHELGHILLHEQSGLHRDRPVDGVSRNRDALEFQADVFASRFLMPSKLLKTHFNSRFLTQSFVLNEDTASAFRMGSYNELRFNIKSRRDLSRFLASVGQYNGLRFVSLAEQFKVSIETMAIRLEELDLTQF